MSEASEAFAAILAEMGITISATFIPFSQSRNAKPNKETGKVWRSLNWRVTVQRNGRDILETDYSQGEGHCPSYNAKELPTRDSRKRERILFEVETGREARLSWAGGMIRPGAPIPLNAVDVLPSLVMDANVLDYGTFEEWAENYGYEADSRSAEAIYHACLETALKLRAAIGEAGIERLREAGREL